MLRLPALRVGVFLYAPVQNRNFVPCRTLDMFGQVLM